MNKQLVQGDVMLEKIESLPSGLKKAQTNILAYGETSGHGHEATGDVEVLEDEKGELYLNVETKAVIKHLLTETKIWTEEHLDVPLEKGIYKVVRQNEYDAYEQAVRRVQD